jgi:transcriptional regulator with XRE-family HTH domain
LPRSKAQIRKSRRGQTSHFNSNAVGALIKAVREGMQLSQGDLAAASGAAKQAISNLERGAVTPSIPTIQAVCRPLGLDPLDVLRVGFDLAPAEETGLRHQIAELLQDFGSAKLDLALSQLRMLKAWNIPSSNSED